MKPLPLILLFAGLFTFSQAAFCQEKNDTIITYYDYYWKPIKTGTPQHVGAVWPENGKWHRQDYYYPSIALQMNGWFADKECKIRDGVFTWYNRDGMMEDSCLYVKGKKEGTEIEWDKDGYQTSIEKWKDGLPVDTAYWFTTPEGKISAFRITDQMGNGVYRSYLSDGKTVRVEGRISTGKYAGKWIFRDANGVVGVEAMYVNDSVVSAVCFNEKGEPENGKTDCKVEVPASFPGGLDGWRRFLERNLRYPEAAVRKEIQGEVRVMFNVDKEGNLSDVHVILSPDEMLSQEALRIINKSGKWTPAVQYNRKVVYRHVQAITFRLE